MADVQERLMDSQVASTEDENQNSKDEPIEDVSTNESVGDDEAEAGSITEDSTENEGLLTVQSTLFMLKLELFLINLSFT